MNVLASIFLDFNLPNAATWFYFSLLLSVALFFKFSRLLSFRNLDVLTLFLLVPGLLILQEASGGRLVTAAAAIGEVGLTASAPGTPASDAARLAAAAAPTAAKPPLQWLGYLWLLAGSAYLLVRCFIDLALVRRPALSPNLNLGGMAWLAGALFVCLVAVAVRQPQEPDGWLGKRSIAVDETQRRAEGLVKHENAPVRATAFDAAFWVPRVLALLCHLAVVAGLIFIGARHFQDPLAGMAAATFYLLLPYTAYHVGQFHHVWPAALLIWTAAAYRRPVLAGVLLGVAAGTVYFPVLLFPPWLSFYWRRGAGRFTLAFVLSAGLCLGVVGVLLLMDGALASRLYTALSLSDWQPWRLPAPGTQGFWTGIQWAWAYRMPVFIAYLAFVLTTTFWPAPKNLAHMLALSAAILIGIQFWYADRGGAYVLWYLPVLLLLAFRPNLTDGVPPTPETRAEWPTRLWRFAVRQTVNLLRPPVPAVPVK